MSAQHQSRDRYHGHPTHVDSPHDVALLLITMRNQEIRYTGRYETYDIALVAPRPPHGSPGYRALVVKARDGIFLVPVSVVSDVITWHDAGLPLDWWPDLRPVFASLAWVEGSIRHDPSDDVDVRDLRSR